MTDKFLIWIAASFLSVFFLSIATVLTINSVTERTTVEKVDWSNSPAAKVNSLGTQQKIIIPAASTSLAINTTQSTLPSETPSMQPVSLPSEPSRSAPLGPPRTVLASDIDQLADAVKLGQPSAAVSKDVWIKEVPVAQGLLQGLCDCDQRNWLNHFVQTGNFAISGSDAYYQSLETLAKLSRSNQELTAAQASH